MYSVYVPNLGEDFFLCVFGSGVGSWELDAVIWKKKEQIDGVGNEDYEVEVGVDGLYTYLCFSYYCVYGGHFLYVVRLW